MNAINKPQPLSNDAFQGALERVYAKSRCDHRKPSDSESRVAAEMLRQMHLGKLGIHFQDPDTCEADWSDAAMLAVLGVILKEDRGLVTEWLEAFCGMPYPMSGLLKEHPHYPAKCDKWESENETVEGPIEAFKGKRDEDDGVNVHG